MTKSIFEYQSYKDFVNEWVRCQPKEGYGQLRKMAEHVNIHSVIMSQVFRGDRDLSLEQAVSVAKFIGLTEIENDYFLLLVQHERAGTEDLKKIVARQMKSVKANASALKNRVKHEPLSEAAQSTFYSHWYYSAIRLGTSLSQLSSVAAIARSLDLDPALVAKTVRFLLEHGLILEHKGKLKMGPAVTHVGHDSPFVSRHHTNWRIKALHSLEGERDTELHYTGPMALSREAAGAIKEDLARLIERATKKAVASDSETLNCLVVDWFQVSES